MGEFLGDLRVGVRQFVRRPGFAAAAIATLALGVGLNTTLFSVVNAMLFRETAVSDPGRLVEIYSGVSQDIPQFSTSYPDFLAIREGAEALSGVAGHAFVRGILTIGDRPVLATGEAVTDGYFETLGVRLAQGRPILAEDNASSGSAPVIVISHGLWQRRLGGRADVVGTSIRLSGIAYAVIGIAPPAFTGTMPGLAPEFWVPAVHVDRLAVSGPTASTGPASGRPRLEQRGARWLFVKGRLADGASVEQARAQIETIFGRLRTQYPDTNDKVTSSVVPITAIRFHPMLDGYVRAASAMLMAAVGLVLLVACANVASMLLARGTARRRELAIRAAVGAGRGRLLRQLLTENLVLAITGGAVGTLVAWWAGRALTSVGADVLPMGIAFDFSVDTTVLLFSVLVTGMAALAAGLAPAWSASTPELVPALKEGTGGFGRRRRISLRDALVVGQLALSLVLLVAGALLGRGLLVARSTDAGFDADHVAMLSFNLQMNGYDVDRAVAFRDRAVQALRALPGVTAVSPASRLPLAPDITMEAVRVQGHHTPEDEPTPIDAANVGADYFTVVGVPILEGRAFSADDEAQGRRVTIVNETMAKQYWPGQPAVGQRIYPDGYDQPPLEVIGVARDHKVHSVGEAPRPYLHLTPTRSQGISLAIRTSAPAAGALPMLRQALLAMEPDIIFTEDVAATEVVATTMAPTRIGALLMGAFGALALLLAAVGLYGVIAYAVSLRTREVGIRLALGAERAQVLWMMLRQGGRLALVGIALGAVASAGVGRLLDSLLYGVSGFDPAAYGAAAAVLLAVAALANVVPALGAARIDPVRALRNE
ncbi:MAG: ABC transporter permease [Vicinamibacterales bacterium]